MGISSTCPGVKLGSDLEVLNLSKKDQNFNTLKKQVYLIEQHSVALS